MSTRTQIAFETTEVKVYKHSDGYPDGVLPTLLPFIDAFMKSRGFDPEYMVAQLCHAFLEEADTGRKKWCDVLASRWEKDFTGYGVDTEWHEDLDYRYIVRKNGAVDVFSVRPFGEDEPVLLGSFPQGTDPKVAVDACTAAEGE